MLLKNHLIEVFKKASLENNFLLKENIVLRWVHRFGVDSLNDLLINSPGLREIQDEEENQEQTTLIDQADEKNNKEEVTLIDEADGENRKKQIKLELSRTFENVEEKKWKSNGLEISSSNGILTKDQNSNYIDKLTDIQQLPLPNIKNLRKWINNEKKAS